ncbi:MAG: SRPBCC domain-containing protein [Candidatus Saccharimonadales bacterium]
MNQTKLTHTSNVLTLERTINAPKDKVWEAWTNPDVFAKWWGPRGWETTVKHMDFNPGGYLLYGMKCVDENQGEWYGQESWGKMEYEAIDPQASFTYTDYFTDENGKVTEGMPAAKATVAFEEVDGKTKMTNVTTYPTEAELTKVLEMGMEEGIKQTIDRLEELLQ